MMGIQGLYKTEKIGVAIIIYYKSMMPQSLLLLVYVVKWPFLGLQRAPENSKFAPSLRTLCFMTPRKNNLLLFGSKEVHNSCHLYKIVFNYFEVGQITRRRPVCAGLLAFKTSSVLHCIASLCNTFYTWYYFLYQKFLPQMV